MLWQQDFGGHAGNERAIGVVNLQLQADGLDITHAAADVTLGGKIALHRFEDDGAFNRLARRQAHRELLAVGDEARFRLGRLGADPGLTEVNNGHNRCSGVYDFALASGTYGYRPTDRRINLRVAEAGFRFGKLRARVGDLRHV